MNTLPIASYKEDIINLVDENYVVVLVGETGSGKSTQVPQYLSEHYDQVFITEPRIMAAKTLAQRVAAEMDVTLGEEVGYMTGYDKCASSDSKIVYCTDGLQLVRTVTQKCGNQRKNVLIIDEVHEWNCNIETLIAWCKFMYQQWNTKVVIMSATVDAEALSNYFENDVSVLNIPGNLYDVTMERRHENQLIPTIEEKIGEGKNTLVFVSGKREIEDVIYKLNGNDAVVLPLHGEMDWNEQRKCFESYDKPKVVVATNVAQTSLTIPDINAVVDSGLAKVSIAKSGVQGLFEVNISKADCLQRKGRAGRTQNGEYILCSNTSLESRPEYDTPEIQRSILDRIVLQLAITGLDAEELEFFHQPEKSSISQAKKELRALGAFDADNQVTELGKKMVKMPVSVQLARMIVEADKYGVTEQVMTIAAIVEMGGLLDRDHNYSYYTREDESDLLAELDVWNEISKYDRIDFYNCGINKKAFFRIKDHIKKLKEVLSGIVELKSNNNREAILKSCISGMISDIYTKTWRGLANEDGDARQLDRKSCVRATYEGPKCVVGIPRTIEFEDRWHEKRQLELLSFVTALDNDMLFELVPEQISEETTILGYDPEEDAIKVSKSYYFRNLELDYEISMERNHPQYAELKAQYEMKKAEEAERRQAQSQGCFGYGFGSYMYQEPECQEKVDVDGNLYTVKYTYYDKSDPYIVIDEKTLFTTEVKNVYLENGKQVEIKVEGMFDRKCKNMVELRNIVENQRVNYLHKQKCESYTRIKPQTLSDVLEHADKLGKVELTHKNGGYSEEAIYRYGCISLNRNTVSFKLLDNEETATANTQEALQFLFNREVEHQYPVGRFSAQKGKKKKNLTPYEEEVKMEFDSLVRELLLDLTIENAQESLVFLEEYFNELEAGKVS